MIILLVILMITCTVLAANLAVLGTRLKIDISAFAPQHDSVFPTEMSADPRWSLKVIYRGSSLPVGMPDGAAGSQVGQDRTVMDIFHGKRGGFYVDLASNHAVNLSNTLRLDVELGWSGICIEPNPQYHQEYAARRSCTLVSAAVGQEDDKEVVFHLQGAFGSIEGFDRKPGGSNGQPKATKFRTVSLWTLFEKLNVPSVVDYFSLDIEGAELYTMEKFPFHKYTFLVMTVERPRKLRPLLEENGYVYVKDHGTFGDELYIHRSIPNYDEIMKKYARPKPLWRTLGAKDGGRAAGGSWRHHGRRENARRQGRRTYRRQGAGGNARVDEAGVARSDGRRRWGATGGGGGGRARGNAQQV